MSEPIRVLQVFNCMDAGGAETFIMNVYRQIDRKKIQFDFVIHGMKKGLYIEEIQQMGGKIFEAPKFKKEQLMTYKKWWSHFFYEHPIYKVVHSHIRTTTPIIFYTARKRGLITIGHSHNTSNGGGVRQRAKGLSNFFTRKLSTFMFGCSDEAGKWMFGEKGLHLRNYRTINNGIDLNKFHFDFRTRTKLRTELDLTDSVVFGHVGRFASVKNHRFLIELFPDILTIEPKAKLIFLGAGPLLEEMQSLVRKSGLQEKIFFLNKKKNIHEYMMAMDIFLFPSLHEGLPLVLIESQATGLRGVVSDRVNQKANITGKLNFCDITNKQQWIDAIRTTMSLAHPRSSQSDLIRNHGYDIEMTAFTLQEVYLGLYE